MRAAKVAVPFSVLQERVRSAPPIIPFRERLERSAPMAVIAEVKRASPSKGDIAPGIDAAEQALTYAKAGAAGISILTEPTWFKGTLDDMLNARLTVNLLGDDRPAILRKDFIVDEYQVLEARAYGADTFLLIVASLDDATLAGLMQLGRDMGMEPLVEVNNSEEMARAIAAGASVIGVNNRDLRSFNVDLGTTDRLAAMVDTAASSSPRSAASASRADVERFQATAPAPCSSARLS